MLTILYNCLKIFLRYFENKYKKWWKFFMKKRICNFIVFMIIGSVFFSAYGVYAQTNSYPKRVINVVYDDSGSMINTKGKNVDTWCEAKYAMEVFSAMLGENDKMNIFCMSDYENGTGAKPKLSLKGSDGTSVNVSKVHNMVTKAGNTPFNAVKAAYNNLKKSSGDEKWIVVLTDGEFQGVNDINSYFSSKASNINVMFLGIGADADGIKANEKKHIYFEKAKNGSDVLNKITGICTRVFNSNKLIVDSSNKTINFDVPMAELTIFAQGANVSINSIKKSDGKAYQSSSSPVTVKYSKKATTSKEYKNVLVDKNLVGSVVTFKDDFNPGDYSLEVSGAQTIEVYYKPNIEIAASLSDQKGNEVTDLTDLEAGTYKIGFGFVKKGTNEKVVDSKLLGDVKYSAIVTNNGKKDNNVYSSGDSIQLEEGELNIKAEAKYLQYNSVSTDLNYKVFKNKTVGFELIDLPKYKVDSNSITNSDKPIQYKVTLDGKELSNEQWQKFENPVLKLTDEKNLEICDFRIDKSQDKGIINIYPQLNEGKTASVKYENMDYELVSKNKVGIESWKGKTEGTVKFDDGRSWFEQNKDKIIKGIIGGFVLFLILGYIPPFKKYLPKTLKSRPKIEGKYKDYAIGTKIYRGKFVKDTFSAICPYRAQRGTITYAPSGSGRAPDLKVKAKNSSRMLLINQNAFKDRDDITFNGSALKISKKAKEIGAGVVITYTTPRATFTCIPKNK